MILRQQRNIPVIADDRRDDGDGLGHGAAASAVGDGEGGGLVEVRLAYPWNVRDESWDPEVSLNFMSRRTDILQNLTLDAASPQGLHTLVMV